MPICPTCYSKGVKKNGYTRHQKQNHLCLACHHQFVEERTDKRISEETRTRIQKALFCTDQFPMYYEVLTASKDIAPRFGEEIIQITWRDFTSPPGKDARDLSEKLFPFPKSSKTISV